MADTNNTTRTDVRNDTNQNGAVRRFWWILPLIALLVILLVFFGFQPGGFLQGGGDPPRVGGPTASGRVTCNDEDHCMRLIEAKCLHGQSLKLRGYTVDDFIRVLNDPKICIPCPSCVSKPAPRAQTPIPQARPVPQIADCISMPVYVVNTQNRREWHRPAYVTVHVWGGTHTGNLCGLQPAQCAGNCDRAAFGGRATQAYTATVQNGRFAMPREMLAGAAFEVCGPPMGPHNYSPNMIHDRSQTAAIYQNRGLVGTDTVNLYYNRPGNPQSTVGAATPTPIQPTGGQPPTSTPQQSQRPRSAPVTAEDRKAACERVPGRVWIGGSCRG